MDEWIQKTLAICEEWRPLLTRAADSDKAAKAFLEEHGDRWAGVVDEQFGSEARRAILEVQDPVRRSQLLKSVVSIVDLTRRLNEPDSLPGGLTLALLQIQAELQRTETRLKRLAGLGPKRPSQARLAAAERSSRPAAASAPEGPPAEDAGRPRAGVSPKLKRRSTLPPPSGRPSRPVPVATDMPVGSGPAARGETPEAEEEIPETSGPVIPIGPEDLVEERELEELADEVTTLPVAEEEQRSETPSAPSGLEDSAADADEASLVETVDQGPRKDAIREIREEEDLQSTGPGPGDAAEFGQDGVEIRPVDLLDEEVLDEPVVPLKKKKEGSGLVNVADVVDVPERVPEPDSAAETPARMPPEEEPPDAARLALLESFVARLREADSLTPEMDAALDLLVSILSTVVPVEEEDLSRLLQELDRLCLQPERQPGSPEERREAVAELLGLADLIRQTLHQVFAEREFQGIEPFVGPVSTLEEASALPAVRLAARLVDDLSRWRLPPDLLQLRGPALAFHVRVRARKGVPVALPVPENSLEFGLVADGDTVYLFALGLVAPSDERPLGLAAVPGRTGAGVFHALRLPRPPEARHRTVAKQFALTELGRFLRALKRYIAQ